MLIPISFLFFLRGVFVALFLYRKGCACGEADHSAEVFGGDLRLHAPPLFLGVLYPRRALHAVETLDARRSRWLICRFYAATVLALCGLNLPSAGTHATPAPNRAHSGSHAETRRVLRVDGDGVSGSGIIDTIDPFQADQTVAVALAEGHRNAVSP